jgi:hypothetical protein
MGVDDDAKKIPEVLTFWAQEKDKVRKLMDAPFLPVMGNGESQPVTGLTEYKLAQVPW